MLSKFKKKLRTNETNNWQIIENNQFNLKFTHAKKQSVI